VEDASSRGRPEPDFTLTWTEAYALGASLLDRRARELVDAGQLGEAIGVYEEDIEQVRAVVAAVLEAGAAADTRSDRMVDFRTAHAARIIGMIEALRGRVGPALGRTAEALETLRRLDRGQREPIVYDELINGLYSFALARALCRPELAEAAEAVAVAVRMLNHLAAEKGGMSDDVLASVTLLADQIEVLNDRLQAGLPLGMPGSPLPGSYGWSEELAWRYQQAAPGETEVPRAAASGGSTPSADAPRAPRRPRRPRRFPWPWRSPRSP
jgi:hypothetical protein